MFKTRNDLPEPARQKLITLLNARLNDMIDLRNQAKMAHWNVKGPMFHQLHELFDALAASAGEYADEIAERAVQLGGLADADIRTVAQKSTLDAYPATALAGTEHVERVSAAISKTGTQVRAAIDAADEMRDADTADILTEVSRGLDKYLWMVESHLQMPQ